jgi:hypothetical protein
VGIVILCTRCTTTHEFVSPGVFEEGKEARIILTDGETLNGKNIELGVNSLSCLKSESKSVVCIPQSEVKEIRTKNRSRGASDGFIWGTITGIALGVAYIFVSKGGGGKESAAVVVVFAPILGALGGAIIGSLSGRMIGHTDRYIIDSSRQNEFVKFVMEPIRVRVSSIINEEEDYVTVQYGEKLIRLSRSEIQIIEVKYDKTKIKYDEIYITIPWKVFKNKFK